MHFSFENLFVLDMQNVEKQLDEVELLQAMYCNEEEFKLNDEMMLEDLRNWLANEKNLPPPTTISFVLKLHKLDLYVQFPHEYPSQKCAEVFFRSNELKRDHQSKLNKDLNNYLSQAFDPDCGGITTQAINWLQVRD